MRKLCFVFLVFAFTCFGNTANAQQPAFYKEIAAFKRQDSLAFPAKKSILFIGSSSFRLWKTLQQDFEGYPIINRGFGGARLTEVIQYRNEIIFPYQPKQIVIYCGENDIADDSTVTATMVFERFKSLYNYIRKNKATKKANIVFVSIKPSPSRWKHKAKFEDANQLIAAYLKQKKRTAFVNVYDAMLNPDGTVMQDIFVADRLHMNAKGYAIWQQLLLPYLKN
jgi:lysophospholipase L1-like esterase